MSLMHLYMQPTSHRECHTQTDPAHSHRTTSTATNRPALALAEDPEMVAVSVWRILSTAFAGQRQFAAVQQPELSLLPMVP